jgi:predicted glycoside hydrolase/deacetylase ChbG (UPF0249 family)
MQAVLPAADAFSERLQAMPSALREKLIISADDFGIRDTVSAILPLAQAGKVDRVAVLVNYVRSQEEAEALKATGVKIDLHLEAIRLLRSGERMKEGALGRGVNFAVRYGLGLVTKRRIEKEWTAQMERFKELFGRYPDGLNSHEHVHYFPKFFEAFADLGKRYGISFLRFPRQGVLPGSSSLVSKVIAFLWKRDRKVFPLEGADVSDFLVSYDWLKDFPAFLETLPEGRTEIVFHPERKEEYEAIEKSF